MIAQKPLKPKPCKFCKAQFQPRSSWARACSQYCASRLVDQANEKKAKAAAVADKRETRQKLEKLKTRSQWIKECQVVVNKVARLRDILYRPCCISCGLPYRGAFGGAFDAGHMRSVGSAPHMRFWLPQINLQCHGCNRYLGGNVVEYRKGMVKLHGLEKVEAIECMQHSPKWDIPYLTRLKTVMNKKARRLEKRIAA
ncbi:hypothetical protein RD110_10925 [Rhodoferax koreense]|uniref:NinG protein n=1 Tax=Rhodoferax koreensis TaxID=1842727 RepID=A0A1P8JV39_9BURK|nr:recombination protein NinG [Rhodoferax koreense]APW37640.1 hypothetical protein RD110_10925 [Rhodoferax koreense]